MDAKELRTFSIEELKTRIHQWRDELFRSKFKAQTSEAKDSSIFKKLRQDIARGLTVLNEKMRGVEMPTAQAAPKAETAAPAAAPAKKAASTPVETAAVEAPSDKPKKAKKPAAKKKTAKE